MRKRQCDEGRGRQFNPVRQHLTAIFQTLGLGGKGAKIAFLRALVIAHPSPTAATLADGYPTKSITGARSGLHQAESSLIDTSPIDFASW